MNDYIVLVEQSHRLAQAERDRAAADLRRQARAAHTPRRLVSFALLMLPVRFLLTLRLPQPTYTVISPCETCPSQAPL